MPHPAFDKLRQTVGAVVAVGDKVVRSAAPVVRRSADGVASRWRSPGVVTATPDPAGPAAATGRSTTGSPSPSSAEASPHPTVPTPATIAANVAHERPRAKPARAQAPTADDTPGGKLPPRRS